MVLQKYKVDRYNFLNILGFESSCIIYVHHNRILGLEIRSSGMTCFVDDDNSDE